MNKLSNMGSNQASSWANQRKEAIEKAKKLKEERKYNLAMTGEMALSNNESNNTMYNSQNRNQSPSQYQKPAQFKSNEKQIPKSSGKYGSTFLDRPPSQDEINEARNSLRLLKQKMRETGTFQDGYRSHDMNGDPDSENKQPQKKKLEPEYNTIDIYQSQNSNYRKMFKPPGTSDQAYQKKNGFQEDYSQPEQTNKFQKKTSTNARDQFDDGMDNNFDKIPSKYKKPPLSTNNYGREQDTESYSSKPNQKGQPSRQQSSDNYNEFPANNKGYKQSPRNGNSNNDKLGIKSSKYSSKIDQNYNNYNDEPQPEDEYENDNYSNQMKNKVLRNQTNQQKVQYNKGGGFNSMNEQPDEYDQSNQRKNNNNAQNKKKPLQQQNINQNRNDDTNDIPIPTIAKKQSQNYEEFQEQPQDDIDFVECPEGCGRKFNPTVLEKHAAICKKVFQSKRKAFDSAAARQTEEQQNVQVKQTYDTKKPKKQSKQQDERAISNNNSKANKWRSQSEAFRAGMRAARGEELSKSEKMAIQTAQDDGLIPCNHCGRKFNEKAAQKHIPFCESKNKLDQVKKSGKQVERKSSFGTQQLGNATFKKR